MEDQCRAFNWDFVHEEEGMEELLWQSLLHKTVELETRVSSAKEEIIKKEDELANLKRFLTLALKERDEAESKCRSIMLDIVTLKQQLQHKPQVLMTHSVDHADVAPRESVDSAASLKPLPEKGKLLKAVMEAGPLLQTLLVAGALPEWQQPPPRVEAVEIPPVAISPEGYFSCVGRKRSISLSDEGYVISSDTSVIRSLSCE